MRERYNTLNMPKDERYGARRVSRKQKKRLIAWGWVGKVAQWSGEAKWFGSGRPATLKRLKREFQ